MCTPQSAYASVAAILAGVDPRDEAGINLFYTKGLQRYSTLQRRDIQDFLIGLTAVPDHRQRAWLLARVKPLGRHWAMGARISRRLRRARAA